MNQETLKKEIMDKILEIAELEDDPKAENFPYDAPLFNQREISDKPCLELDSIVTLELAVAVMEIYGIKIKDEDIRTLNTVNDIADYITRKQAE